MLVYLNVKPGVYFERKSTPHTQTILRTCCARVFSAINADLRISDRADGKYFFL